MKKVLNFGKIDYMNNGKPENAVSVEINLETKDGKKIFTASAKGGENEISCKN